MTDPAREPPKRMHVEYLAAAAYDSGTTREALEKEWRLLRGPDAILDYALYEQAVALARVLKTPASRKIDMPARRGSPRLRHPATRRSGIRR